MSEAVRAALAAIVEGRSLSLDEARLAMGAVMDGEATAAQLAALLVALRMRGETVEELAGFASAMRERVLRVEAPAGTIDVVGTGGDGSGTFNISTAVAFVVASTGVPVAKHGNRAITSKSGSADVLEALGVRIDHSAESAAVALRENGFACAPWRSKLRGLCGRPIVMSVAIAEQRNNESGVNQDVSCHSPSHASSASFAR